MAVNTIVKLQFLSFINNNNDIQVMLLQLITAYYDFAVFNLSLLINCSFLHL